MVIVCLLYGHIVNSNDLWWLIMVNDDGYYMVHDG